MSCQQSEKYFKKSWSNVNDRVWAGSEFWSNRLQDWKVQNGRLECVSNDGRLLMRTSHLINYRLGMGIGNFSASVEMGPLQDMQNKNAACGILIGAGPELDVWGASLVQQNPGPGGGIFIGIDASGDLFVRDMETDEKLHSTQAEILNNYTLNIEVVKKGDSDIQMTIISDNTILNVDDIPLNRLSGNIALVSHPGNGENPGSFWFNNFEIMGNKLAPTGFTAGPVIATQHTISGGTLKMTVQMAPVGEADSKEVFLEIEDNEIWKEISHTQIITPGYTATFKINDWNTSVDIPYRVKYRYKSSHSDHDLAYWYGTVRHDPVEKDKIVIAGFTGNHNISHPGLSRTNGTFNFNLSGIWYPHIDIVEGIKMHDPDVLFFSGDQVYEGSSPTFPDIENYELDYLYKWYLYCIAYRDLTKDIPTISIPDDHDVYQGNLWGQEGRPTDTDNKGGYVHPAWFVKMVERTQCSNLPDPYDPTPIEQGIGVYYTSITYGGIGIAVLEDRKFKSGCADNPYSGERPDHVLDPDFDRKKIDLPGKKLLGERQLKFLEDWATDWKDQEMKIAVSQTIFANMATHHGSNLYRAYADLDSDGWPQTGRNKAIDALRKGFAVHLAGDQHLASLIHHGIDDWDDGIYSFCVPSIANFYPRAWWPESVGKDRPEGAPQNMGKHKDGFGNLVTVYGVTNPTSFTNVSTNQEPLGLHDKMPGYGIVKMNKMDRTITMECWPRYANPLNGYKQYEGWPKTISQFDNYGRTAHGYLPTISVTGCGDAVVEIRDEKTDELIYAVRIKGNEFSPKVFYDGLYKVIVRDTENNIDRIFNSIPISINSDEFLNVEF